MEPPKIDKIARSQWAALADALQLRRSDRARREDRFLRRRTPHLAAREIVDARNAVTIKDDSDRRTKLTRSNMAFSPMAYGLPINPGSTHYP